MCPIVLLADDIKSLKKRLLFTLLPMKSHITNYLNEWVEPYGLSQYSIVVTNISIH